MKNGNRANTRACPQCGKGDILAGLQAQYNAKINGKPVCPDCKTKDLIEKRFIQTSTG